MPHHVVASAHSGNLESGALKCPDHFCPRHDRYGTRHNQSRTDQMGQRRADPGDWRASRGPAGPSAIRTYFTPAYPCAHPGRTGGYGTPD